MEILIVVFGHSNFFIQEKRVVCVCFRVELPLAGVDRGERNDYETLHLINFHILQDAAKN
jgi:hypothetical protein